MLKLLIAMVLVIVSVQCAAVCTPGESTQPSCHHHKQAPACAHELVPATLVPSYAAHPVFPPDAIIPQLVSHTSVSFPRPMFLDPSPPDPNLALQAVLRI